MKSQMAPSILLAIVFVAAVGATALRAAARRPELQTVSGTRPAQATVRVDDSQSRTAAAIGALEGTRHEMAVLPAQAIFHELHAEGRNILCAVCDSQYESGSGYLTA